VLGKTDYNSICCSLCKRM